MNYKEFCFLVRSDLWRYQGCAGVKPFLIAMLSPGFCYTFWMRLSAYLKLHPILKVVFYPVAKVILRHYKLKYGIAIHEQTRIGPGLFIGHFGGIVVHADIIIGKNCNLSHDVTLGESIRGERKGCPAIGDNVYIGPGAKIFGRIKVGDDVAVGANCVVTKSVPDRAVVVGIPASVISLLGSRDYISRTDYE